MDTNDLERTYKRFVMGLAKDGAEIRREMTIQQTHLLHMAVGVSGEAGEILDAIKKHAVYQKPLDSENLREEIGDVLFYLFGIMADQNISLEDVLAENMIKLGKRYPDGYSNQAAAERADKAEVPEGTGCYLCGHITEQLDIRTLDSTGESVLICDNCIDEVAS